MDFKSIKIFTDGACSGNPGPGGWGAIIVTPDGEVQELGHNAPETTNNRMELLAIIKSLEVIKEQLELVEIYTDSTYVIRGITQWIHGWKRRGWKNAEGKDVANQDLWQWLDQLVSQKIAIHKDQIRWHYVRGHAGTPSNERVDDIAVAYSKNQLPRLYVGPLLSYEIAVLDLPEDTSLPEMSSKSKTKSKSKAKAYSYLSLVDGKLERHSTWGACQSRVNGRSGARFKKAISKDDEQKIIKSWGI
jgi:ribonuclease HI